MLTAMLLAPLAQTPIVQEAYLKPAGPADQGRFGTSMALAGDTLVVGSPLAQTAVVFVRGAGGWSVQASLTAPVVDSFDMFGEAVAVSGNTVVVGAPGDDSDAPGVNGDPLNNNLLSAGAVHVYTRTGTQWQHQAYLKASNTDTWIVGGLFGSSVAVSGETIAVGTPFENSGSTGINGPQNNSNGNQSGAVYVFERSGSNWAQTTYIKASTIDFIDQFGTAVALDGHTLVVGAPNEDSAATVVDGDQADDSAPQAGAAFVFVRSGGSWSQQAYLKASNAGGGDLFGERVALSGDRALIAARGEDSQATGVDGDGSDDSEQASGAAYLFRRAGGAWSQEAYLKPSNGDPFDSFGIAVDLEGDRAVVGATGEDSFASGVDGDQFDDVLGGAGAAYLFERGSGGWSQRAYLKPSNPGLFDRFGAAVAVAGDVAVVSAPEEDSAATGVGGDQSDDSAPKSGAAYAFELGTACGADPYGPSGGANVGTLDGSTDPVAGAAFAFELSGLQGGGTALLVLSAAPLEASFFGGTLLVDPFQSLLGPGVVLPVSIGAGAGQLPLTLPPASSGLTVYAQAVMADASQVFGLAFTNGLRVVIC